MSRIIVCLAALVAAAALTAQAHAGPRQAPDSHTSGTHWRADPCSSLPNAYMTANGRLFALGELLAGSSRLHAARSN